VKVLVMIDIAIGLSIDPPTACSIRNATSQPSPGATLHSSEPSVNSASPAWKVRAVSGSPVTGGRADGDPVRPPTGGVVQQLAKGGDAMSGTSGQYRFRGSRHDPFG
jgi:hypothetical protein